MTGGVTDALDAGDVGHILQQRCKIGLFTGTTHGVTPGVNVLPQQRDLFDTLVGQTGHFDQHVFKRAVDLGAAGVGHHTVAAIFVATFHDGHKGRRAVHLGGWQVVKLFDLGETNVHLRLV